MLPPYDEAFELLPKKMDSYWARVNLTAIGLQESRLIHQKQIRGPARGLWQFEQGTEKSRGGVYGIYLHPQSRPHLESACRLLCIPCDPVAIYESLEGTDDRIDIVCARLLLWTNPRPLPTKQDVAWQYYLDTWRPGRPHPKTWADFWKQAEVWHG